MSADLTVRPGPHLAASESAPRRALLAPFSTRLPPELVERLRIAAPQLRKRQGEIAAIAIDRYLHERGY